MANPLKELPLQPIGFQRIQEVHILAAPKKVWAALAEVGKWFVFNPDPATHPKQTIEMKAGGQWIVLHKDGGSSLSATVTHIEPEKLLRLSGPMGMSHLPVMNAFIFELQPKAQGKETLLRMAQRTFGFIDPELEGRYGGAFGMLLNNIKALAEK